MVKRIINTPMTIDDVSHPPGGGGGGGGSEVRQHRSRTDRDEVVFKVESDHNMVPGDLFIVEDGMNLPCDAVLVVGRVVVDESMLTGESIPVSKNPIDITDSRLQSTHMTAVDWETVRTPLKLESGIDFASQFPGNVLFGGTKVRACNGARAGSGPTGMNR